MIFDLIRRRCRQALLARQHWLHESGSLPPATRISRFTLPRHGPSLAINLWRTPPAPRQRARPRHHRSHQYYAAIYPRGKYPIRARRNIEIRCDSCYAFRGLMPSCEHDIRAFIGRFRDGALSVLRYFDKLFHSAPALLCNFSGVTHAVPRFQYDDTLLNFIPFYRRFLHVISQLSRHAITPAPRIYIMVCRRDAYHFSAAAHRKAVPSVSVNMRQPVRASRF